MDDSRQRTSECSDSMVERLAIMTTEKQSMVMRRFWQRMCAIYGADRWTRSYGDEPTDEWQGALSHCTLADLARAVKCCERDDSGRVPTLGQIRAMAREYAAGSFAGNAAPSTPLPRLEDLGARTRVGRLWIAFLRGEGLVSMGTATPETLERDLEGHDTDAMGKRMRAGTEEIRRRICGAP